MKIAFVLGHELPFPPRGGGGVNSLLHSLTKALVKIGHDVTAYSPSSPGYKDIEFIDGVKHIRLKGATRNANTIKNIISGLPYVLRVRSAIEPCDVLSCHLLTTFLLTNHQNAKVVTHTIHRDPKRYLYLFRLVDRIYSGSDAVTDDAKKLVPNLAVKMKTVYNCVDMENYNCSMATRNRDFAFLYVGRFSRDKGIETMIRAFIDLAKKYPNIRLETVGPQTAEMGAEPDFVASMRELIDNVGLMNRIKICEPIFDRKLLDEKIASADIVCLPSLGGETLNMAVLECARLSKPLIVSDLPANRPLVHDGLNGFFAKAGDVNDWSRVMQKTFELSDTAYRDMGLASFQYVANNFSSEIIAKRYVEDFTLLLKGTNYEV